jgi:hypothetical protein
VVLKVSPSGRGDWVKLKGTLVGFDVMVSCSDVEEKVRVRISKVAARQEALSTGKTRKLPL